MVNIFFPIALSFLSFTYILGQLGRVQLSGEIALILLDVSLGVVISIWSLYLLIGKRTALTGLIHSPLARALFLFFSVCIVSLVGNIPTLEQREFIIAFLYFLRLLFYYSLFLFIPTLSRLRKESVTKAMMVTGFGIVLLGYVQLLVYPDMRNLIYLGWDDHYYRMVSTCFDPNFAGIFLVLYLFFIVEKGRELRKKKLVLFYGFTGIITFLAIFLTYSRTAFLALIVGGALYLFFLKKVRYLLGLGLLSVVLIFFLSNTQYESLNPLRTASINARFLAGENAITIIKNNPVLGVGFNAYRYALERYNLSSDTKYPQHGEAGTDNSLLFVTATTGLVGLMAFLFLWGKIVLLRKKSPAFLASITALFIGSLFINAIFYTFLLLWIILLWGTTQNSSD